jgi:hypothetical protein
MQVVPSSQAQAHQRAGRAGREAPGKCFRLYPESAFASLPEKITPEIQRSNLATVVLQLKAIGVSDVLEFELMSTPPRAALLKALEQLYALEGIVRFPPGDTLAVIGLAVLDIEPPGPENSGSITDTPKNKAYLLGKGHAVNLILLNSTQSGSITETPNSEAYLLGKVHAVNLILLTATQSGSIIRRFILYRGYGMPRTGA